MDQIQQPADMVPLRWYERRPCRVTFSEETMTKQSHKKECDINGIMARYEKTGLIEHVNNHQGDYGDFTEAPSDYQSALDQVIAAQEMFMTIPAKVRAQFGNDPGQFLKFVEDPANAEQLVELGLANPKPAEQEPAVPPAAPPKAAQEAAPEAKGEGTE